MSFTRSSHPTTTPERCCAGSKPIRPRIDSRRVEVGARSHWSDAEIRSSLGNLSTPWLLAAFTAGTGLSRQRTGALVGLLATTGFYLVSSLEDAEGRLGQSVYLDVRAKQWGRIKDDAHARVERAANEARERLDALLAKHAHDLVRLTFEGQTFSLVELAKYRAAGDPALLKQLHEVIDAAPADTFSDMTRAEYDRKSAAFEAELRERTVELERRGIDRRKRDVEQELAALEQRLPERAEGAPIVKA